MTPDRRHSNLLLKIVRPTTMKAWNSVPPADVPANQDVSRETIEEPDNEADQSNYHIPLFPPWMRSTAVLSLVVVAALTAVAGLIYLVIYFKSIKPLTARTSRYCRNKMAHHHHKNGDEEVNSRLRSTHPFFRRT